jgi:hypothetical protein
MAGPVMLDKTTVWLPNNSMQRTALLAAADAGR